MKLFKSGPTTLPIKVEYYRDILQSRMINKNIFQYADLLVIVALGILPSLALFSSSSFLRTIQNRKNACYGPL